jgi:hypothetical protein
MGKFNDEGFLITNNVMKIALDVPYTESVYLLTFQSVILKAQQLERSIMH